MTTKPTLHIISGAGLSKESGIPTFRDAGGTWEDNDLNIVCNYLTWKSHKPEVFDFYNRRKSEYSKAEPCGAHIILAGWQKRWGTDRVRLITQNVDTLLEKAGAEQVVHLHGRMDRLHCTACGTMHDIGDALFPAEGRCPKCGSLRGVKPGIVFFHEPAPEYALLGKMRKKGIPADDIIIVIGTKMEVVTPEHFMNKGRTSSPRNFLIDPNPTRTDVFSNGRIVADGATAGLEAIKQEIIGLMD